MTGFGSLLQNEIPRLRRYARALTRDATRADDQRVGGGHGCTPFARIAYRRL